MANQNKKSCVIWIKIGKQNFLVSEIKNSEIKNRRSNMANDNAKSWMERI